MGTTVKKHEIDMLHGSIWNKLPLFALPVAATAILEQLFHASDVAIVGNFTGDARTVAVAAVGANGPIIGLIVNLFIGIALGAGFYEGALMMCVLIYVVLVSLNKLDSTHVKASRVMNVYVELKSGVPLSALLRAVKSMGIQVNDIQDIGSRSAETHGYILELEIMRPELGHVEAAEQVAKIEQVEFCEEMKA